MLSDNIRNYRKKLNLSQDELAEKVGVSRQSVSFWETGQTQPTIDNIIALTRIFNISSDALLGNCESTPAPQPEAPAETTPLPEQKKSRKSPDNKKILLFSAIGTGLVLIIAVVTLAVFSCTPAPSGNPETEPETSAVSTGSVAPSSTPAASSAAAPVSSTLTPTPSTTVVPVATTTAAPPASTTKRPVASTAAPTTTKQPAPTTTKRPAPTTTKRPAPTTVAPTTTRPVMPPPAKFDLFDYCKQFAIEKGEVNGDYCMYQQPSSKYGGYEKEYFSISYWSNIDVVEFCLHCPLSDTQSHNFYLKMRGGYQGKYEYVSSKYYRSTGASFREASGIIDPAVFSDRYPIPCDSYIGSTDGQNDFMEQSRVGICDLIHLLKNFVEVEKMECDFSDFDFVNF